jgi:hypothetical protein
MAVEIASIYEEYALCHLYKKENIETRNPEVANYYGQEAFCRKKTVECSILKIEAQKQNQEEVAALYDAAATEYAEAADHYNNAAQRSLESMHGLEEESIAGDAAFHDDGGTVEDDEAEATACIEKANEILAEIQELEAQEAEGMESVAKAQQTDGA